MTSGNAFTHARCSLRPLERQLVFRQGLVHFVMLVIQLGVDLRLRELFFDTVMSIYMGFNLLGHRFSLPSEVLVPQGQKVQERSIFAGYVERDAPLDETHSIWIVRVRDHESNSGFGKVVERLGVIVIGLVAGSLLEKVAEAPESNAHTRRAANTTKRPKEADATFTVQMKTHNDRERESEQKKSL